MPLILRDRSTTIVLVLADGICKATLCDLVAWYVISNCGYKYSESGLLLWRNTKQRIRDE